MPKVVEDHDAISVEQPSFATIQHPNPRERNLYLGCLPIFLILLGTLLFYPVVNTAVTLFLALLGVLWVAFAACLLPLVTAIYLYFRSWWTKGYYCCCIPKEQLVDLFVKTLFFFFQFTFIGKGEIRPTSKDYKVDEIKPKQFLVKKDIDYALDLAVPPAWEDEFIGPRTCTSKILDRFLDCLHLLPMWQHFDGFEFGEDPVEFVMNKLGQVYPTMYQIWPDKQSDKALARFCKVGLAAARVESVLEDKAAGTPKVKYFVVRTAPLARIEVVEGYARMGSDCYFDADWNVVRIEDHAFGDPASDNQDYDYSKMTTFRPGDAGWAQAKFRFRSAVMTMVTIVDHLYGIHLQVSNLLVVAMREQLDAAHPLRRFLTPYTYQTISINNTARQNLTAPRALANRTFPFTEKGIALVWAACPSLIMGGAEVLANETARATSSKETYATLRDALNRKRYINNYLKAKRGIDTPYYQWNEKYWDITYKFVKNYLKQYYGGDLKNLSKDHQVVKMIRQYLLQIEFTSAASDHIRSNSNSLKLPDDMLPKLIVDVMTSYICLVTSGHEQVGTIAEYAQDAAWCASKYTPGANAGTKNGALNAALLISFTSTPMPLLMKPQPGDTNPALWETWSHLFPDPNTHWPGYMGPVGKGESEIASPTETFDEYQKELQALSIENDAYNDGNTTDPVYCFNPKYLETSVSV